MNATSIDFIPPMRLTTFTDFSLRVLIYIAVSPRQQATIAEIAASFRISGNHLMKVVHQLGRAGLLTNRRGKGGGLALARPAASINVGEVVRAMEGRAIPAECFQTGEVACGIAPACRLRGILGQAVNAFHAVLDQYTLADLVQNREELSGLLALETDGRVVAPMAARRVAGRSTGV